MNDLNYTKDTPFYLETLRFLRIFIKGNPQCIHVFSHKYIETTISGGLPVIESYDECAECKKRINQNNQEQWHTY